MILFRIGDITDVKKDDELDAIVNSSNSMGIMNGGVSGAIKKSAGDKIVDQTKTFCKMHKLSEGDCYSTDACKLKKKGIKKIYHAVIMFTPNGRTSLHTISACMTNILDMSVKDKMTSIAFTGLGSGYGGLVKDSVAAAMINIAQEYNSRINIYFIDTDEIFMRALKRKVNIET
jgi:O-acetyl-ADP-ribose deacetylase (regulator of RNase III)